MFYRSPGLYNAVVDVSVLSNLPTSPLLVGLYHWGCSMRLRGRIDKAQNEIVIALRGVGAKVLILSNVGQGCPDLLCKFRGTLYLLEVKSKGGRLTEQERDFFDDWQEVTTVVYNSDEALKAIGAYYG